MSVSRGIKRKMMYFATLLLVIGLLSCSAQASRCIREPDGRNAPKSAGSNGYEIKISGNPERYVPGETYTVSLQRATPSPIKFSGFLLNVEPQDPLEEGSPESVGTFELFSDALTRFSDRCPNAVTHTSTVSKTEVQILWTAPSPGNGCLRFRAMVMENRDTWFMDDETLTKELCEEERELEPEPLDPCCACNEAKYEVTFEGLWSRNTHPNSFPENEWNTFFTDLIGASHTVNYRFWDYGGVASEGLRQLAEWGATRVLESELKAESNLIRTIIKARGINHPTLNAETFAVFRVDRQHHVMSIVSRLNPSPDWFVGVSRLELCLPNCSWVEKRSLDLYPWDAGTDSGITYLSDDSPTTPREKIRRLTQHFPNDERSPFFDPAGTPMKPLARLYVQRQRLYGKSCYKEPDLDSSSASSSESDKPECEMSIWGGWNPCSVTCGKGKRIRYREYIHKERAVDCSRMNIDIEDCFGAAHVCPEKDVYGVGGGSLPISRNPPNREDNGCAVGEWGPWSQCSTSCGKGMRSRTRQIYNRPERKKCTVRTKEEVACHRPDCPPGLKENPLCAVTSWSEWSPCSSQCGRGFKTRSRVYLNSNEFKHNFAVCSLDLEETMQCVGDRHDCGEINKDCDKYLKFSNMTYSARLDLREACRKEEEHEKQSQLLEAEVCNLKVDPGPCRSNSFPRFFYDTIKDQCLKFNYGGCEGNGNNFETMEECQRVCETLRVDSNMTNPLMGLGHFDGRYSDAPQNDCTVSDWSDWSACSVSCGKGIREKFRFVTSPGKAGGKRCPERLRRVRKCKHDPCAVHCVVSEWETWSSCSVSCGGRGYQQRERRRLVHPRRGGKDCGELIQTRSCHTARCPFY